MALLEVKIYPNVNAKKAEEEINKAIKYSREAFGSPVEMTYELLIEQTVTVAHCSETRYTLLINFEEPEEPEE